MVGTWTDGLAMGTRETMPDVLVALEWRTCELRKTTPTGDGRWPKRPRISLSQLAWENSNKAARHGAPGATYVCSINRRSRPLRKSMPAFRARRMRSFNVGSAFFHAARAVSAPAMTTATSW